MRAFHRCTYPAYPRVVWAPRLTTELFERREHMRRPDVACLQADYVPQVALGALYNALSHSSNKGNLLDELRIKFSSIG